MSSRGSLGVDGYGIMGSGEAWEWIVRAGAGGLSRQMSEIGVLLEGQRVIDRVSTE